MCPNCSASYHTWPSIECHKIWDMRRTLYALWLVHLFPEGHNKTFFELN